MQKTFGLVGYPLSHSFSKEYFTQKFIQLGLKNYTYLNIEIDNLDSLKKILIEKDIFGFNVTIPYKICILEYLNHISAEAKAVGAVNTVKVEKFNNKLVLSGYNTDVYGFRQSIKPFLESHHYKALILGNGGASKAVQFVMKELGIDFRVVTRNPQSRDHLSYEQINSFAIEFNPLIVNTTPLGMFPSIEAFPNIPYGAIGPHHLCIDLIYNPVKTVFLQKAEQRGAKVLNGLSMLHLQAEKAWEIWEDRTKSFRISVKE